MSSPSLIYCLKSRNGIEVYELKDNLFYGRLYVYYPLKKILILKDSTGYPQNTLWRMFSGQIITEEELSQLVNEVKASLL